MNSSGTRFAYQRHNELVPEGDAMMPATPKHLIGAPELIVEIGSPSTRKRDETIKRRLYERFGVEEYWTVDPELDAIRVYRLAGTATNLPRN